jgi:hypothetical protein
MLTPEVQHLRRLGGIAPDIAVGPPRTPAPTASPLVRRETPDISRSKEPTSGRVPKILDSHTCWIWCGLSAPCGLCTTNLQSLVFLKRFSADSLASNHAPAEPPGIPSRWVVQGAAGSGRRRPALTRDQRRGGLAPMARPTRCQDAPAVVAAQRPEGCPGVKACGHSDHPYQFDCGREAMLRPVR